jgi:hypothetical protein
VSTLIWPALDSTALDGTGATAAVFGAAGAFGLAAEADAEAEAGAADSMSAAAGAVSSASARLIVELRNAVSSRRLPQVCTFRRCGRTFHADQDNARSDYQCCGDSPLAEVLAQRDQVDQCTEYHASFHNRSDLGERCPGLRPQDDAVGHDAQQECHQPVRNVLRDRVPTSREGAGTDDGRGQVRLQAHWTEVTAILRRGLPITAMILLRTSTLGAGREY